MRWLVVSSLFLGLVGGCAARTGPDGVPGRYDNSLLRLGTGFAAKEACTCLFVAGHDEAFCRQLVRVKPDIARFKVDRQAREVHARALGLSKTVARYQGEGLGCTIVE